MSNFKLLKYTKEEQEEVWKVFGLKRSVIDDDIDAILEWFNKQPHLVSAGIERDVIERLLIMAKGSREKTKKRIDSLYRIKAIAPAIFQNREDVLDFKDNIWAWHRQASLPLLFEGCRISVLQITDPNPSVFSCDSMFKSTYMIGDVRLKYDYMSNDIWLADLKNLGFAHLPRMNPLSIQKGIQLFQEGFGLRVRNIHVFNAHPAVHAIHSIVKLYLLPKIFERIIFHDNLTDVQKYIPKKYLPSDFGGEQISVEELADIWQKEMCTEKMRAYLLDCSKKMSNEVLRPRSSLEDDPMAGSFKQLQLD